MVVYINSQIRKSKFDMHYQGVFKIFEILPNHRYNKKKIVTCKTKVNLSFVVKKAKSSP